VPARHASSPVPPPDQTDSHAYHARKMGAKVHISFTISTVATLWCISRPASV
jgi:hypothetical protein